MGLIVDVQNLSWTASGAHLPLVSLVMFPGTSWLKRGGIRRAGAELNSSERALQARHSKLSVLTQK